MVDEGVEALDVASGRRRYWTVEEKRRIVKETLSSSLSVASLARQHGVNANQLFYWRKLFRAGQLGGDECVEHPRGVPLLPVCVDSSEPSEAVPEQSESVAAGLTMNIEIPGRALVSLEGAVDAGIIRAVLESLRG
jgi:transposase